MTTPQTTPLTTNIDPQKIMAAAATVATVAGLVTVAAHAVSQGRDPRHKGVMAQTAQEVFKTDEPGVGQRVNDQAETALSHTLKMFGKILKSLPRK